MIYKNNALQHFSCPSVGFASTYIITKLHAFCCAACKAPIIQYVYILYVVVVCYFYAFFAFLFLLLQLYCTVFVAHAVCQHCLNIFICTYVCMCVLFLLFAYFCCNNYSYTSRISLFITLNFFL